MTEQLAVAVLGANGRMGAEAVKAVEAAADLKLVAALGRNDSLETLVESGARVVVDLTVPESTDRALVCSIKISGTGLPRVGCVTNMTPGPRRPSVTLSPSAST